MYSWPPLLKAYTRETWPPRTGWRPVSGNSKSFAEIEISLSAMQFRSQTLEALYTQAGARFHGKLFSYMTPFLQLIFELAVILLVAKAAGYLSIRLGQPSVLGELLAGVLLGPSLINILGLPFINSSSLGETIS